MTAMPVPNIEPTAEEREAKRCAIAEARAEIAAGRAIPHGKIEVWLESRGASNELPPPSKWK